MNLANALDSELDEAVKQHIRHLFNSYFLSRGAPETKVNQLKADIKQLESDVDAAVKAVDGL